jgi:hypothetical protein
VPRDLFAEKQRFFYEVEFGRPGMPTQTKLVDLGREVTVGAQIRWKASGGWSSRSVPQSEGTGGPRSSLAFLLLLVGASDRVAAP